MRDEKLNQDVFPQVSFDEFDVPDYDAWKAACDKLLKGVPFEKKMFSKTYEGLTLKSMYWQNDLENLSVVNEVPGQAPYTRGTKADGYAQHSWVIAQGVESCDLNRANEALKNDLKRGGEAVYLAFDEQTCRMWNQPCHQDDRRLSVTNLEDMSTLLQGLDLTKFPLCWYAGAENFGLYSLLMAWAKKENLDPAKFSGLLGADPLAEAARWGSVDDSLDLVFDRLALVAKDASQRCPNLATLVVDGTVYEEAGANAVDQLAAIVTQGAEMISRLMDRGLTIHQICSQLWVKLAVGADFFMEIAKIRGLRRLWATMIDALGGDEQDQKLRVFAQTSAFTQTTIDPYVNLLRSSTQIFSAVVGGVDMMHVHPFDAAVRESTEQANRIARNQQIMFKTEFDLTTPVDPAGGSWYVESLTEELAKAAWSLVGEIDQQGGLYACLTNGFIQKRVNETLKARQKALATRKDRAVGVNMYANMTEEPLTAQQERQIATKTSQQVQISDFLKVDDFSIDQVVAIFHKGASLAQVAELLNRKPCQIGEPLTPRRWTEQYEALRMRTRRHVASGKPNVKVFLANMGPVPQHKPRADFSRGFFEVAEFDVVGNDGFSTVDQACQAALASGAKVVVICSTDATYPEIVPELARKIKENDRTIKVVLAGAPAADMKDCYDQAGVDYYIHVKADCLGLLTALQIEGGMAQ